MIPIALDPSRLRLAVAGAGPTAARRARLLLEAGGAPIALPNAMAESLGALDLLWIADLPDAQAAVLAAAARRRGVLVNVEDRPALCDFHNMAEVRRGDLLLGVATGGQSPALAARIRAWLARAFGPEWSGRIAWLGARRRRWRAEGCSAREVARLSSDAIDRAGWLR